jgi:hypothetical protein
MVTENVDAIVDAAHAELEASAAALAAEQAQLSAEDAARAASAMQTQGDLLQHQRHAELIASYENRIAELEASCQSLREIHSHNQTVLQEAMTRLELVEERNPVVALVDLESPQQPEPSPSISEPLEEVTETPETLAEAEPEAPPAVQKRKRRIL